MHFPGDDSKPPIDDKLLTDRLARLSQMAASGASPEQIIAGMLDPDCEELILKFKTQDQKMLRQLDRIRKYRRKGCTEPVLITGPTGTGKEVIARCFTKTGSPFIAQNCGGLPQTLIHSIFFGYEKGAFTGADKRTDGLLVRAKDGIIFLDEVADLPPETQAVLLRAIQEKEIYYIGATEPTRINCQFVAATKFDLFERVKNGQFREDLYARLAMHTFELSSLKDRPDDIPLIAKDFGWTEPIDVAKIKNLELFNVRALQAYITNMEIYGEY